MNKEQPLPPTYRIGPHSCFPAGLRTSLIIDAKGQNQERLPNSLAKNLSKLTSFCPLQEHARKLWSEASLLEKPALLKYVLEKQFEAHGFISLSSRDCQEMLVEILNDFVKKDFLVSSETFFQCAAGSTAAVPKIASLGLITRNNVAGLSESLESYIKNARHASRSMDFFVIDDSSDNNTRQGYRDQLKKLQETYQVPISYAGLDEKKHFSAELERKGIPGHVLQFALFDQQELGMTYGINRNAFLLHTAGEGMNYW